MTKDLEGISIEFKDDKVIVYYFGEKVIEYDKDELELYKEDKNE